MMETVIVSIDEELQDCIGQLDVLQKKSLLELIKSFVKKDKKEMASQRVENTHQELKEPSEEYSIKESSQDEMNLDGVKGWIGKPQTIEEYNKELEDAVARVEAGEFYTHEEAMAIVNSWCK